MNPRDYRYTTGHTWVKAEGAEATIGLTHYAQDKLGRVLFLELSQVGDHITRSQPCGTVESDKATADIMSPISGEVLAVNEETLNAPEMVNEEPYGKGWLLRARLADPAELKGLMTAEEFEAFTASS